MCDTNKVITEIKLLRLISKSFITKKYKNNRIQTINAAAYNKFKTNYKLSKAYTTPPVHSLTGVTNNNIQNYGHGKYHLQVTFYTK